MSSDQKNLTATELELMNIVWKLGEASVKDILQNLPCERPLAYTSASTILRILEKKQILTSRKEGRTHIYVPTISKDEYGKQAVGYMIKNVFSQTPSNLAKALVSSYDLTEKDLTEIKQLIDERINDTV